MAEKPSDSRNIPRWSQSEHQPSLGGDIARPLSHWSSSYITALSLVESFIVMLRQLSYAIKNQLKAPKAPYEMHFLPFLASLSHKGGFHAQKESIIESKAWIYLPQVLQPLQDRVAGVG